MARVLILGSGAAGLLAAEGLAEVARDGDQVTVIGEQADFQVASGSPWNGAPESAQFDLPRALERKGVSFRSAGARRLHPESNQVELGDGTRVDYDVVLIAAGPRAAFEEIEGLGPDGFTQSLCEPQHASACARAWHALLASPGPVIVGAVQGAACLAPAYESALRIDAELRRHGVRATAPITFVTPEPFVGELGVGGLEDSRLRLEQAFVSRGISWIDRAVVDKVEPGSIRMRRLDEHGQCIARYALRFHYALMMPPSRPVAAVAGIDGLTDDRGFLIVDQHLRNPRYHNVYAAGAAITSDASAAVAHKAPYMIEGMVETALRNIRDQLDGREPRARASWSAARLAELGAAGLAFMADPHSSLEPQHGVRSGEWISLSRCASCDAGQAGRPVPLR